MTSRTCAVNSPCTTRYMPTARQSSRAIDKGAPNLSSGETTMNTPKMSGRSQLVVSVLVAAMLYPGSLALGEAPGTAMDTTAIERLTGAKGAFDEKIKRIQGISSPKGSLGGDSRSEDVAPDGSHLVGCVQARRQRRHGHGGLGPTSGSGKPRHARGPRQWPGSDRSAQSLHLGLTENHVHAHRRSGSGAEPGDGGRTCVHRNQGNRRKNQHT